MTDDDFESHVDDILNAVNDVSEKKISRVEVEKQLNRFIEYGVPLEQAKETLVKKYGGAVFKSPSSLERVLISDLKPNQRNVKILAHVVAVNPKEVTVKGETRKIYYGILEDESGTVPFTAWNDIDLKKGDIVEITNAYTREWQGLVQLNLGDRVRVEKTEKSRLPKSAFEPKQVKVKDLRSGMGRVDVTARVLDVNERDVEVNGETRKVFSGVISDETGKAQFTCWHDFKLKKGEVYRITGGYVKSWKGIPQLTFDSNASVKKLDKSKILKGELQLVKMPLHELIEKRGALDVEVEGTVIDIRSGSGFVMRCPECNRVLQNNRCSIHGEVEGKPDLRVKLVLDDGTGAVDSVLNKELSEKLLGKTLDECKKMGEDELINEINNKFFAHRVTLRGNALSDEFGTTVIAKEADFVEVNVREDAEKLSEELGGLL